MIKLVNKKYCSAVISAMLGIVIFASLFVLFSSKSSYPYRINFYTRGQLGSSFETSRLIEFMKSPFVDEDGDTFYIDDAQWVRKSEGYLEFGGRYYCKNQAVKERKLALAEAEVNKRLLSYLAEQNCYFPVAFTNKDLSSQILEKKENEKACVEKIQSSFSNHFKTFFFLIWETERTKKIFFISLILSIFFSLITFLILRGRCEEN